MLEQAMRLPVKGPDVNIEFLCHELKDAFPIIKAVLAVFLGEATITSGHDGNHSAGSAHYKDRAIDLRIRDLSLPVDGTIVPQGAMLKFIGSRLALVLNKLMGDGYYVVLESDHFHLEHARPGVDVPNIKNLQPGKRFYMQGSL